MRMNPAGSFSSYCNTTRITGSTLICPIATGSFALKENRFVPIRSKTSSSPPVTCARFYNNVRGMTPEGLYGFVYADFVIFFTQRSKVSKGAIFVSDAIFLCFSASFAPLREKNPPARMQGPSFSNFPRYRNLPIYNVFANKPLQN